VGAISAMDSYLAVLQEAVTPLRGRGAMVFSDPHRPNEKGANRKGLPLQITELESPGKSDSTYSIRDRYLQQRGPGGLFL
jgi:hypothetical protein